MPFFEYVDKYSRGGEGSTPHNLSDTGARKLVANIFNKYLTGSGYNASKHVVAGFGSEDFDAALKEEVKDDGYQVREGSGHPHSHPELPDRLTTRLLPLRSI